MRRRFAFPILSIAVGVAVALAISEAVLRILKIAYGNSPLDSHVVFHHVHPSNYRFRVFSETGEYGGYEVYYDESGLIANPDRQQRGKEDAGCRIAFLGDSFTEALQVPYTESFVGILESGSKCLIRNYGVSSYSPIYYLLQWRRMVRAFDPDLLLVQLYSNDVGSDTDKYAFARKNENGEVVAIAGSGGWVKSKLRSSYLARFLRKLQLQLTRYMKHSSVMGWPEENPDITELSGGFVRSLAAEVEDAGTRFALFVVPSKSGLTSGSTGGPSTQFSDKWRRFARTNGIPFLDLTRVFQETAKTGRALFYDTDMHFNSWGHRVTASELSRAFPEYFSTVDLR